MFPDGREIYCPDYARAYWTVTSGGRTYRLDFSARDENQVLAGLLVTGSGPGSPAVVHVYDSGTGNPLFAFSPYGPSFKGGVQVALVTSAAKAAYDMAFGCLRPTGTLLVVGLPSESLSFPAILMAAGEVRIQASAVGTRKDLQEVLALGAAGKLRCHVTRHPLGDINEVLEQLRRGRISGRTVIVSS